MPGYLGFRFNPTANSGPAYGWMRLILTANTPGAVILDWAWDTRGASIITGQVPEPSTWLFSLAGTMLVFCRRRTAAKT